MRFPPQKSSICQSFWKSNFLWCAYMCFWTRAGWRASFCSSFFDFLCQFYARKKWINLQTYLKFSVRCAHVGFEIVTLYCWHMLEQAFRIYIKVLQGSPAETNNIKWPQEVGIYCNTSFLVLFAAFLSCVEEFCHQ